MFGLEMHRDMFGAPRTGAHAWRVGGLAAVDVIATVVGAVLLALLAAYTTKKPLGGLLLVALVALFSLGIAMHRLFGVRTTVDKILFGSGTDRKH